MATTTEKSCSFSLFLFLCNLLFHDRKMLSREGEEQWSYGDRASRLTTRDHATYPSTYLTYLYTVIFSVWRSIFGLKNNCHCSWRVTQTVVTVNWSFLSSVVAHSTNMQSSARSPNLQTRFLSMKNWRSHKTLHHSSQWVPTIFICHRPFSPHPQPTPSTICQLFVMSIIKMKDLNKVRCNAEMFC